MKTVALALAATLFLAPSAPAAQQAADSAADVSVAAPAYAAGRGPLVLIDEGHGNFHTSEGRYAPFAAVLRNDGYRVAGLRGPLTRAALKGARVLVVANPLHPTNADNWTLPTPAAFTAAEAEAVKAFVRQGGSLWLIADHMPFPGAAEPLARAFGFTFVNGFVGQRADPTAADYFRSSDGTLADHALLRGGRAGEAVTSVRTFTGSAFRAPPGAQPLLRLSDRYMAMEPQEAWRFDESTPKQVLDASWLQGATLHHGRGRVAVFGEAAMFTAQTSGGRRVGFSAEDAAQNKQFLLNVADWLSGLERDRAPVRRKPARRR